MRKIFINQFGRLRSGWRVLIFIVLFIPLTIILGSTIRVLYELISAAGPRFPHPAFVLEMISRGGLLLVAIGLGYLCARVIEGLPWRSLGLTFHAGWFRDLLVGSAVGFATLIVAVAIATTARGLTFSLNRTDPMSILTSALGSGALLFVAALAEEAMFRGYVLQTLARAKLAWLGVLLTSVPFGLAHLTNPNVVAGFTMANTVLAGVWLATAYLRTRSLWLPLGVHWVWNWALGWFFGLPISGINLVAHPLLNANDTGPFWLTGGSYGIEGGAACTVALILLTIYLWRTSLVSATPDLLKLTSEENPATPEPVISIRPADEHA